jgi:hypothetical protein
MHKRKVFALGAVAVALMLVAGGLMASNMGFKLNRVLNAASGSSLTGTNAVGLPYNQQVGLVNCGQLGLDMGTFATAGGPITNIQKFLPATDTYLLCNTTRAVTTNFAINAGESVRVRMNTSLNYIVVGSHDPIKTITLKGPSGTSLTGTNEYSYPYHSTAINCGSLALEIGGFATAGGPVTNIQDFLPATDTYLLCNTTRAVTTNFATTPGKGYRIRVTGDVSFVPSHY